MELRYDDTLGAVDDESALLGHVRDRTEIHVLYGGVEILMVRVGAIEFELCFEGHAVCKATFQTLVDSISRRVDIVVKKLQHKVIARIGYRKIFGENFIKTLAPAIFERRVELEEILEAAKLHVEKIREREGIFNRSEINARFFG